MAKVIDGGPWRGPDTQPWVERINHGAWLIGRRADGLASGEKWEIPWVKPPETGPSELEKLADWGDR